MSVLVGFSKVNLMDVLPEDKPCSMPILGIGFYLEQEEKKSFFFTVDFMDFDFATVSTLTTAISKELPQAQIHIVTTHNHGGESCTSLDMEKFCLHAKECAKTATKNAQKAKVKIAAASIDEKLTFTRRIFVPTLDSSFTCFYGIDFDSAVCSRTFGVLLSRRLWRGSACGTSDLEFPCWISKRANNRWLQSRA